MSADHFLVTMVMVMLSACAGSQLESGSYRQVYFGVDGGDDCGGSNSIQLSPRQGGGWVMANYYNYDRSDSVAASQQKMRERFLELAGTESEKLIVENILSNLDQEKEGWISKFLDQVFENVALREYYIRVIADSQSRISKTVDELLQVQREESRVELKPYKTQIITIEWKATTINDYGKVFVSQKDPKLCWAAVLETAFRANGRARTQSEFHRALQGSCPEKHGNQASLSQIVFSAHKVATGVSKWISGIAIHPHWMGGQDIPLLNWQRVGATDELQGIWLIRSISSMIDHLKRGASIAVGQPRSNGGHVVLVTRIDYNPTGILTVTNGKSEFSPLDEPRLTKIWVLDPTQSRPTSIPRDPEEFVKDLDFVIALYP